MNIISYEVIKSNGETSIIQSEEIFVDVGDTITGYSIYDGEYVTGTIVKYLKDE